MLPSLPRRVFSDAEVFSENQLEVCQESLSILTNAQAGWEACAHGEDAFYVDGIYFSYNK